MKLCFHLPVQPNDLVRHGKLVVDGVPIVVNGKQKPLTMFALQ